MNIRRNLEFLCGPLPKAEHDRRRVGRYEENGVFVSTVRVYDSDLPFETAIEDPRYESGDRLVIVQAYASLEEAKKGHEAWVETMTMGPLPKELRDVGRSWIAKISGEEPVYPLKDAAK